MCRVYNRHLTHNIVMWLNSKLGVRPTFLAIVVMLVTCEGVHNLKCRSTDHSKRQEEFVDIAEECNNSTAGDRWPIGDRMSSSIDSDYYSPSLSTGQNDRTDHNNNNNHNHNSNRKYHAQDGRRNNNREFTVHRQDFNNNNNRGNGEYGDRDTMSCGVQPQQYSKNNGGRQWNYQQGSSYNPSQDYDTRQSDSNNRQPTRRYRRDVKNNNNNNKRYKAAATSRSSTLLGNNRFRNVTKTIVNPIKGSILEKMDACTIHCVFNQLEMLNSNSRPDKSSIVNIMTNQIKDVELKEFIQDSIDECFDTLELDSHTNNKCEFTKNFAMCMENKAQRNCDDWDETTHTNKMNSALDGNNQQDMRRH